MITSDGYRISDDKINIECERIREKIKQYSQYDYLCII